MGSGLCIIHNGERAIMNPTTTVDTAGQAAMYGGAAATGVLWGLSVSDVAVIGSMIVAVLGFIVHAWATIRKDRREAERHAAAMAELRSTHHEVHEVHEHVEHIEATVDRA